jgi:hypothetical protein
LKRKQKKKIRRTQTNPKRIQCFKSKNSSDEVL